MGFFSPSTSAYIGKHFYHRQTIRCYVVMHQQNHLIRRFDVQNRTLYSLYLTQTKRPCNLLHYAWDYYEIDIYFISIVFIYKKKNHIQSRVLNKFIFNVLALIIYWTHGVYFILHDSQGALYRFFSVLKKKRKNKYKYGTYKYAGYPLRIH